MKLSQLTPDTRNANRGTARGRKLAVALQRMADMGLKPELANG